MPKLVKLLIKALQHLQKQVVIHQEQWAQQQNPEALHSLRICLRQLRSLLRPLRSQLGEAMVLDGLVKNSMESTNRIRDYEVLIIELKQQQMFDIANIYEQQLQTATAHIGQQLELEAIIEWLITLPLSWQKSISTKTAGHLESHISQHWQKQSQKLLKLMQQENPDKHHLRILIKQLRYNSEVYKVILPKHASKQTQQLKKLQELLGTWHDYFVWLTYAQQHTELYELIPFWQQQMQYWEQKSDQALKQLKLEHFVQS